MALSWEGISEHHFAASLVGGGAFDCLTGQVFQTSHGGYIVP